MLRKMLVIVAVAAMAFFCLSGCKKGPSETEAEPNETVVKTMAEYESEAEKEITRENMEAELEKIEGELAEETTGIQ